MRKLAVLALLLLLSLLLLAGCGRKPRLRFGNYPTSTLGTKYPDPNNLGRHGYRKNYSEKNGIVYTCKAGHIDITHLRIAADWTAYLAERTYNCLMDDEEGFDFEMKAEPSRFYVGIEYPDYWSSLSEENKEVICLNLAVDLGKYFSFNGSVWHEILTWFGFKCTAIIPEFPSAFSWEDVYSNVLGSRIAAEVLRQGPEDFSEAMTIALDKELQKLGVQSRKTARAAAESVRDKWFSSEKIMTNIKKRNFDIGITDGYVTPTLIPEVSVCPDAEPLKYPAPNLNFLKKYRMKVRYQIEPKVWEAGKILKIAYAENDEVGDMIEPIEHFPAIMDYIKKEAIEKFGPDHDVYAGTADPTVSNLE
jgi:hypothetical protein